LSKFKIVLSDKNNLCLYIPSHYAHGFLSLEDDTIISYKCSDYYYPNEQKGIKWNDDDLNIKWGVENEDVILSEKDEKLPILKEALKDYR